MGSSQPSSPSFATGGIVQNTGWVVSVGSNSTYYSTSPSTASFTIPMSGTYTLANGTNGTITSAKITFASPKPFKRKRGWNALFQPRCAECGRFAVQDKKSIAMLFCKRCRGIVNRWVA